MKAFIMSISYRTNIILLAAHIFLASSCTGQTKPAGIKTTNKSATGTAAKASNFKEGKDYFLFERVRLMDKVAFTQPVEAYSVLLPKGWTQQSAVEWKEAGIFCAGTHKWMKAQSADGKMSLKMTPPLVYSWPANQQMNQTIQDGSNITYCRTGKPFSAEEYLRNVYGPTELVNPQIVSVKPNEAVVTQLMEGSDKVRQEMMQYGASQVNFYPSAINAKVKWPDGREALLVIGVKVMEGVIPNPYNGTSSTIYTTQVTNCDVFTYAAGMAAEAENIFVMIMGSFRSNPAWNDAVNKYWKDVRTQSNIAHVGRIKMIDDQTRAMGNRAIANGQARLNSMDDQMRSWEQTQASSDRMHTNFIKTIREVENYRDETGKIELTSGFNHAWSRSDGSSFILSNNSSFDPAAAALDNRWKEMKKVD
jgi:hypothetical protein